MPQRPWDPEWVVSREALQAALPRLDPQLAEALGRLHAVPSDGARAAGAPEDREGGSLAGPPGHPPARKDR